MIDVHSHFLPESYVNALKSAGVSTADGFSFPEGWSVEKHLAMMDDNKIQTCVLSVSSPGTRYWSGSDAVRVARDVNEEGAAIMFAHPIHFGMNALLPMPDVDTSLKEIEYALDVLKLDGVGLYTNYEGAYLGDPKFRPVLEELNRRKVTVFVHPVQPPHFEEFGLGFPAPMVEYPFDTTRTVISLLRAGVLKELPDIRWITTHGGGAVPFLAHQRMTLMIAMQLKMDAEKAGKHSHLAPGDVASQIASLYFDLTAATIPPYLQALQQLAPSSQLLLGFDFPFMPPVSIQPALRALRSYDNFSSKERDAIFDLNARALYPRLAKNTNAQVA